MVNWEQTSDNVVTVQLTTTGPGWRQPFLELSDVHFDSPHCNRRLLVSLLSEAKDMGAPVSIFGDMNDVMQGRDDPRRSLADVVKEYAGVDAYADAVVENTAAFLEPFADNIIFISEGNHEVGLNKHTGTNITRRICRELGIIHMGYSGFVRFKFEKDTGGHRTSRVMFFHHGKEGGAVNLGSQRSARWQSWAVADIYIGGHIHQEWRMNRPRVSLSGSGKEIVEDTLHISLPTLKEEWNMRAGYPITKALPPSPIGAMWLLFKHHPRCRNKIFVDAARAR